MPSVEPSAVNMDGRTDCSCSTVHQDVSHADEWDAEGVLEPDLVLRDDAVQLLPIFAQERASRSIVAPPQISCATPIQGLRGTLREPQSPSYAMCGNAIFFKADRIQFYYSIE